MPYTKIVWTDRIVQRPNTYRVTENGDGTVTVTDDPGKVVEVGTPRSAANMNRMETALESVSGGTDSIIAELTPRITAVEARIQALEED